MNLLSKFLAAIVVIVPFGTAVHPCSTFRPASNIEMVRQADIIVRASAEDYSIPPSRSGPWAGIVPNSQIRFKVLELIRGKLPSEYLVLPGILVQNDDFNDHASPYSFVRPEGRHGNCFAITYRSGGQFLLFLKKNREGDLTVYWYALAPVNEQLHSPNDPWLLWVRKQAKQPSESVKITP
jgi:hypothetical protein